MFEAQTYETIEPMSFFVTESCRLKQETFGRFCLFVTDAHKDTVMPDRFSPSVCPSVCDVYMYVITQVRTSNFTHD